MFLATCWVIVDPPCQRVSRGTNDPDIVETIVAEEILILRSNEGLNNMLRDRLVRYEDPVLVCEFIDQGAVACMDARRDRRIIFRKRQL